MTENTAEEDALERAKEEIVDYIELVEQEVDQTAEAMDDEDNVGPVMHSRGKLSGLKMALNSVVNHSAAARTDDPDSTVIPGDGKVPDLPDHYVRLECGQCGDTTATAERLANDPEETMYCPNCGSTLTNE